MKGICLFFLLTGLWLTSNASAQIDTSSVTYGKFGKVMVYMPKGTPTSVTLFVSGDGGWNGIVTKMATTLVAKGAMVLGIDARHYGYYLSKRTSDCLYPAADFEELSLSVQKKYKFSNYYKPVLLGYSYGAVLIYGILAQAPANTFKGAVALGFSPDINLKRPLCKGNGLTQHVLKPGVSFYLERSENLSAPFIALNGLKDLTCPFEATASFMKDMPNAELVPLKVGHGFSAVDNWQLPLANAYQKVSDATAYVNVKMVNNLPLNIVPSAKKNKLPLVFMISGDGGWTSFDQSLAEVFASNGLSVVGLDAQKYFWKEKTPNGTAEDIAKAIMQYRDQMDKDGFILAGYSFGASVVPFVASRLPAALQSHLKAVVALSPDESADFEIHIADMLNISSENHKYDVIAEFKKLKIVPYLCCFGSAEGEEIRQKFNNNGIKTVALPGNHHFNNDYSGIVRATLNIINE
ncbi:MAG TPA: AcvB/VirJ family lysyl-phosphatidylglycerol hydrolase [Pedobacter sp.]|uniref:AcvB/VirJ family lysyl-phosphatidylglycerol hydrolase n=1 Tax=Pedobacter sp. TaxID=1411316 RepID=UPI002CB9B3A1|nr:AcvB/VirJ family lysyl-phosphatidylglycerol hydrolase [Pedobacter sp.]HMI03267.1 AcvB/VirJ family lysyl-phosphatidylglycerol hydrolase [Pedobacter sp.]